MALKMKKLIAILFVAVTLTSCVSPLLEPSLKMHDTVHADYINYVENDATLSEDSKKYRKDAVKTYGLLLDEVKK